jgi:glycosyltransferase involved in cell wall biosynthesis
MWLVIDDGSTDITRELVEEWQKERKVPIRYYYQENQGMHGAHNAAYRLIDTELNTCIDSDDYMPDDAVEKIVSFWKQHGSKEVAGIIALNTYFDGELIGTDFPEGMLRTTVGGFYNHGGRGDKKLIYRTEVINNYPEYPLFKGEKYVSLGYKYELIDQDYELLTMNEPVCCVNYMPDGSSMNMFRQYIRNPQGFAFIRKQSMVLAPTGKRRYIEAIHYVSSSIMLRNRRFLQESPRPWLVLCAIPFGILWYAYIRFKTRNIQ